MDIFYFDNNTIKRTDSLDNYNTSHPSWVRLVNPKEEEVNKISEFTSIPKEEFMDFLEDEERSRVEQGKYLQIIYRVPNVQKGEITTTSFSMFFTGRMFITVERSSVFEFEKLSSLLRAGKQKFLFKKSAGYFIFYILDKINDEFLNSVQKIGLNMKKHRVYYEENSEKQLRQIYNSNVTLSYFNNSLISNLEVLNTLRKSHSRIFNKADIERFSDLYYDTLQIMDTAKVERDVLSTMFNFQTILASYRLNTLMKRITALALIIAVPTLISSIYGMNLVNMPLAESRMGFPLIIAGMFLISILGYVMLRKFDWV